MVEDTMEKWQTRALEAEAKLELNEAEMHRRLERQAKAYEAELQAVKDQASTSYRDGYEARGKHDLAFGTKDRASTSYREGYEAGRKSMEPACVDAFRNGQVNGSYREGYEAGKAATPHPGFRECVKCAFAWDERQGTDCPNCEVEALRQWRQRPVLASNPLDPKCASIFEAAEILASVTACMSKLAKALEEMSEKAEAAEKALAAVDASRKHYQRTAWEQEAELMCLRERDRDLKRQLGETQEALGKATERAERAEKMLTTERRS